MYKLLILAYLIGQSPIETQQTFQMGNTFNTMKECKQELLLQTRDNGTYDVLWEFVNDMNFEWDWLVAGCKNDATGEEFQISPDYPLGLPDELKNVDIDKQLDA